MEYKLIANEIKDTLKVNVFENSRKRPIIDARSLFCYILRKDFNLTLHSIADIYKSKGKNYNHATVIHSVNNYEIASKDDKRLEEIRNKVLKPKQTKNDLFFIHSKTSFKIQKVICYLLIG